MGKKLSVWQRLLLGSVIMPICLHLQYPLNLIATGFAILLLLANIVKDQEKYTKFNFAGMFSAIIGGVATVLMITGKLSDFSLFVQILCSMGMLFLGIILIGVGNHIVNPEKVPKKTLYLGTAFFSAFLGFYWFLFYW